MALFVQLCCCDGMTVQFRSKSNAKLAIACLKTLF